jgi:hypothetical protein
MSCTYMSKSNLIYYVIYLASVLHLKSNFLPIILKVYLLQCCSFELIKYKHVIWFASMYDDVL